MLPYLHDLGVDWVYLSPILEAEPGSSTATTSSATTGSTPPAAVPRTGRALGRGAAAGMGVLVDIVPNHVGVATPEANPWWGRADHGRSAYADYFDIDWAAGGGSIPGLFFFFFFFFFFF